MRRAAAERITALLRGPARSAAMSTRGAGSGGARWASGRTESGERKEGHERTAPRITRKEMLALVQSVKITPIDHNLAVEHLGFGTARFRLRVEQDNLRPGGTVSGPILFTLTDLVAWSVVCTLKGRSAMSVTTSVSIDFLSKPKPENDLIAVGETLKNGKRLVVSRVSIFSDGRMDWPVAHATVTYSVPPTPKL
mmetsp:Transcript_6954/g.17054  ORF Transcript_6954/g.17054 Transcript_6954/m.17054 type:complete len:195 (+) Transcript_6954:169-753(+)